MKKPPCAPLPPTEPQYPILFNNTGAVVDSAGDNILAEFKSVVDAVNCAVEIQRDLAERNTELPDNRKMRFRIGVNLGDVIDETGRIYGEFYLRRPSIEPTSAENMAFPLPVEPSIAVLPFVNLSEDPEQDYFSDGITEQIITSLSNVPNIFVIARNSTFTYKDRPVKVQQVAEELGVRYVLEGSVQRSDDRVRITVQLIDATTGYHLWAENYDRKLRIFLPCKMKSR